MDPTHNADLKIAQEPISRLTEEIVDLKNEITQLQVCLDRILLNFVPRAARSNMNSIESAG